MAASTVSLKSLYGPMSGPGLVGVGVVELVDGRLEQHAGQLVLPERLDGGLLLHRLHDGQVAAAEVPGPGRSRAGA